MNAPSQFPHAPPITEQTPSPLRNWPAGAGANEAVPATPPVSQAAAAALAAFAPEEASQRAWLDCLEAVCLHNGECLFRQGDPADAMFLIESGQLAVVLEVAAGQRAQVRRFGPGQLLGEMALYHAAARTATVEAVGQVRLWRLGIDKLRAMERNQPALALALHRRVAAQLAERVAFSNVELKEPLARLAQALHGLAASDFAPTAWDRPGVAQAAQRTDEVGEVAQAMEFLVRRLHDYLAELRAATAAREAMASELRIAGQIQQSLLPPPLQAQAGRRLDFAAAIQPARETGGDLYDGFFLPDGRFFTLVGDVSGKGVSAAVFMAVAAMAVRALARDAGDPGTLLTQANTLLCERNQTLQFVTAFAAILEPATGELWWANAGHPSPAVLAPDGSLQWLEGPRSPPLAMFEESRFPTQYRQLAADETLLVYSDGVSEAMNGREDLFGDEGIAACFAASPVRTSADTVARVVAAVHTHAAGAPQNDDITIVALRRDTPAATPGPVSIWLA